MKTNTPGPLDSRIAATLDRLRTWVLLEFGDPGYTEVETKEILKAYMEEHEKLLNEIVRG